MKRPCKGPDCFRALRVCDALSCGGFACALLGCGVGYWDGPRMLAGVLVVVGFAALLGGWALGLRFVVCPHCGRPLYDFPRMPSQIPSYCPHCGKKL